MASSDFLENMFIFDRFYTQITRNWKLVSQSPGSFGLCCGYLGFPNGVPQLDMAALSKLLNEEIAEKAQKLVEETWQEAWQKVREGMQRRLEEAKEARRERLLVEIAVHIKRLEEEIAEQQRLKEEAKGKRRQANAKKRLEVKAKQEGALDAFKETTVKKFGAGHEGMPEKYHGNPSGKCCKYRSQGEISKEAGRVKISEDSVTEIPGMPNEGTERIEAQIASPTSLVPCPNRRETSDEAGKRIEIREEYDTLTVISPNDLARTTTSSFASSHNSSDVPNCNLIKAEDKTVVLHFSQQQSSIGSEVRIDILDANNSQDLTTMSDAPSQETRFPHDINNIIPGTSTLMPDGPSQQTRLANDNNNTTHGDPVMMPDGASREMGELEMTANGSEEGINMSDEDDGSSSSGDDDDDDNSASFSDDEVQPRFPNGVNNAILGFTGQAMASIVAAQSPHSLSVRLFAFATGIGFFGSLFAALFLKRHPNIAKTLFKIGVSASAFTVMIALGQYLPTKWYLDTTVPAVACLIIAVVVTLSKLD
ncbi:uncharacterized protein [Coffea arabica]|uniref:Uncharacterized protein isoform X2 n=1 Tax=Coffea arabica TaxID=13443 RepID=A0ABM4W3X6_COFAR